MAAFRAIDVSLSSWRLRSSNIVVKTFRAVEAARNVEFVFLFLFSRCSIIIFRVAETTMAARAKHAAQTNCTLGDLLDYIHWII